MSAFKGKVAWVTGAGTGIGKATAVMFAREGAAVIARKYPKDGAGILSSIVQSDGFVILDEALSELVPGGIVEFLPFSEVFA